MKPFITFILLLFSTISFAQDCKQPVSNSVFQSKYGQVARLESDQKKLDLALTFSAINCFTSNQIKLVAKLFIKDSYRLDYCKLSYNSIVDKNNFYDVYDAFKNFSSAIKLYEHISNLPLEEEKVEGDKILKDPVVTLSFPKYKYPNWYQYKGTKGCSTPISDKDFMVLAIPFSKYQSDEDRYENGSFLIRKNCLSLAQTMKLTSLFKMEAKGLNFLKDNIEYIYDRENYRSASQCFNHNPYKSEWEVYCKELFTPVKPKEPVKTCNVAEAEFKTMIESIDKAGFADDQMTAVNVLNKSRCFTTAQVLHIMNEFSYPNNKFDVAKLLFKKCTDKENYSSLKGQFLFVSYEDKFQELINEYYDK